MLAGSLTKGPNPQAGWGQVSPRSEEVSVASPSKCASGPPPPATPSAPPCCAASQLQLQARHPSSFLKPADSASLPAPGLTAGGFVSARACQHISFPRQELGLGRPIIPHLESFSSAQRTSHGRFFILFQATQTAAMPLDELSGEGRAGVSVSV